MSYHAFGDAHPRAPRPTLADDPDFYGRAASGYAAVDDDFEAFTWPELIDQRLLQYCATSAFFHDEAEDDDPDHGIEDLPQDARDEDGI